MIPLKNSNFEPISLKSERKLNGHSIDVHLIKFNSVANLTSSEKHRGKKFTFNDLIKTTPKKKSSMFPEKKTLSNIFGKFEKSDNFPFKTNNLKKKLTSNFMQDNEEIQKFIEDEKFDLVYDKMNKIQKKNHNNKKETFLEDIYVKNSYNEYNINQDNINKPKGIIFKINSCKFEYLLNKYKYQREKAKDKCNSDCLSQPVKNFLNKTKFDESSEKNIHDNVKFSIKNGLKIIEEKNKIKKGKILFIFKIFKNDFVKFESNKTKINKIILCNLNLIFKIINLINYLKRSIF